MFAGLLAAGSGCSSCGEETFDFTQSQRGEGTVTLESLSVQLYIEPARVTSNSQRDRVAAARLNASVADMILVTGDDASGALTLTLRNVHPDAIPIVQSARDGSFSDVLGSAGCPSTTTDLFLPGCDSEGAGDCTAFDYSRDEAFPTTLTIEFGLSPCRQLALAIEPPASTNDQDVTFAVLGASPTAERLTTAARSEIALRQRLPDFFVLLGDQLTTSSGEELVGLYESATNLQAPVIALVGDEELGADEGELFEETFGAFQFRWTFRDVQFINLYSARGELGTRGLLALEAYLADMAREDAIARSNDAATLANGQTRRWPAVAFTYTPPLDPNGGRERSFVDRTQAARAMSLMANYGVDTLFAGRIIDNFTVADSRPELHVSTASASRLGVVPRYLFVTLSHTESEGSTPVGDRFMTIEPITF